MSDDLIYYGATGAETQLWGVGIVQEIDAAAMSIWLSYRHLDASVSCADSYYADGYCGGEFGSYYSLRDLEDFQYVKFGALINF